eukprot:221803-Rhodomonas_salina.3
MSVPDTCAARSDSNPAGSVAVTVVCTYEEPIVVESAMSTDNRLPERAVRLSQATVVTEEAAGNDITSPRTSSSPSLTSSLCSAVSTSLKRVWVPENASEVQDLAAWSMYKIEETTSTTDSAQEESIAPRSSEDITSDTMSDKTNADSELW